MTYIIANWKMNMTLEAMQDWFDGFSLPLDFRETVLIAPPVMHLAVVSEKLLPGMGPCAQDVSAYDKGAHTGEVGAFQLVELCKFCIVGHSERKELSDVVLKKRDACLQFGITPIVCFTDPVRVSEFYTSGALLAWEDPDNISVDGVFKPKDVTEVAAGISLIRQALPQEAVVIYGGSVNRENIQGLRNISGLNGVLVGSASLNPVHFMDIIKAYAIHGS